VEYRHHLYPDVSRIYVPGSHHRLVQSLCDRLALVGLDQGFEQ
jgi:hypothetical protein